MKNQEIGQLQQQCWLINCQENEKNQLKTEFIQNMWHQKDQEIFQLKMILILKNFRRIWSQLKNDIKLKISNIRQRSFC